MDKGKQMKKLNIFIYLLFAVLLIITGGCARTVTTIPGYGNVLNVEVTFAGTIDPVNNKYFVVFSTDENYKIPLPAPYSLDEFLEPGDDPRPGSVKTKAEYYSYYYSTWSGYSVVDSYGYAFSKGPFLIINPSTREAISDLGTISNKLKFEIRLEKIFGTTLPKNIYVDIISAAYPAGNRKELKDRISPPTNSFQPIKGTFISGSDDPDSGIKPSLDIVKWSISLP